MIDESVLKSNFLGRDGFRWFVGQVPAQVSPSENTWGERVPVRIFGYHTPDGSVLPDTELPLALILKPVTAGAANRQSSAIVGGEFVVGFFLDGDDAQQPVITGVIDKYVANTSDKDLQSALNDKSTGFQSVPYYAGDQIPAWRVSTSVRNPDPESLQDSAGGKTATPSGNEASKNEAGDDNANCVPSINSNREQDAIDSPISGPTNCGDDIVGRIQVELGKLVAILEGVQKYYDLYVLTTVNKVVDIGSQIQTIIRNIAAVARTLTQRLRNFIIKQLREAISSAIEFFLGDVLKEINDSILGSILDIIFCIFETTIESLPDLIADFVIGIVGSYASAPVCSAEAFVNGLINNVANQVEGLVNDALGALTSVLSGPLQIVGNIFSAVNDIIGLLGFLCLTKECAEVVEFSASPWGGPSQQQKDNYEDFLNDITIGDPTAGIEDWLKEAGFGDASGSGACQQGPTSCGPPDLNIFGGGLPEVQARAQAIVNNAGSVVGALITNRGAGYSSAPFVTFSDSCNYGFGAAGYAVLETDANGNNTGRIDKIVITNPGFGYLPKPTGKTNIDVQITSPTDPLGNGINTSKYTTPDGEDILYSVDPINSLPSPGGNVIDGGTGGGDGGSVGDGGAGGDFDNPNFVQLPPGGGDVQFPGGNDNSAIEIIDGGDFPFIEGGSGISTNPIFPQPGDADNIETTPVVGCLDRISILSTGFGYSQDDEIITVPEVPGLELEGQYTEYGQLVNIKITGQTCGFVNIPQIRINSRTGSGVRLRGQLTFITLEEAEERNVFSTAEFEGELGRGLQVIQCILK